MLRTHFGQPSEAYLATRFAVLRQPLGMQPGSEQLPDDHQALHVWIELDGSIVSVGRAHLIPDASDGSGADHAGPNAPLIPPFGPLADGSIQRPAFQIRQMGTRTEFQRNGHAAQVLKELERTMVEEFGARTGFLQAREHAIPFYLSQGWMVIDGPYEITNIGPHRSMMKAF
jgi:predicted GNAT family N-acyltransferase